MTFFDINQYPILAKATDKLAYNTNALIGREDTLESISAVLHKTEMSNVLLMGEAGQGKTAVMQEFARRYANEYLVLTTSIPQLTNDRTGNVSTNFKELFKEITAYRSNEPNSRKIVIFIDEFHVLPKETPAAVEDLKPEFARSSQLGIYLIGATTYKEYHDDIEPNEAFKQRFDIVKLPLTDDQLTFKILKSRMRHQYANYIQETAATDKLLKEIIQYTDNFVKDSEQPRKATNTLDEMIGWVRIGYKFDHALLVKLFALNKNIRLDLQTDATKLKQYLANRVYNQDVAIDSLMRSVYASILDLNNPSKPRSVILFVGSTGVGKTELAKAFTTGMYGPDSRLTIFDMSEYKGEGCVQRFQYNLTDKVLSAPTPVILLDEVDRCDNGINELLFSVFDEARLHDRNGREVNFSNVFFILTTNKGEEVFNSISGRNYSVERMQNELASLNTLIRNELIQKKFPAPLLARINDFVLFAPMAESTNVLITKRELKQIQDKCLLKQNVRVHYDEHTLINYVTREKLDTRAEAGGARQIVNLINKDILASIADYIIHHPDVLDIYVTTVGLSRSNNKHRLKSTEHVEVTPMDKRSLEQEYKKSVHKYRNQVQVVLKNYLRKYPDLKLPANANKAIFKALAHNGTDLEPEIAVNKLFKPLEDYLKGIDSWDELYKNQPQNAPFPRPKTKLNLSFKRNTMIVS